MIDRVVLDVEPLQSQLSTQATRLQERRETGKRPAVGLAIDRQELAVAPQVVGTCGERRTRERRANTRVVVADLERSEAILAYVQGLDRILLATFAAFQIDDIAHRGSLIDCAAPSRRSRRPWPAPCHIGIRRARALA